MMKTSESSEQDLIFPFTDCIFGDVLTYEYLLHASICLRLQNLPLKEDSLALIARSNNHANCLKGIHKFLCQDLGDLPGDEICKIRFRIFSVIDEMFFHQHHLCKINSSDTYTGCCCEEHKFLYGYPKAYDHFISLLMLPEFEFENDFSITQLLMDFKVQLVIQRAQSLDDLHILALKVFGPIFIRQECEKIPFLLKGHFGGEFMRHCQSFHEKFSSITQKNFEKSIVELLNAHPYEKFEIFFRNFLKNVYLRLPIPGIFANDISTESRNSEKIDENVQEEEKEIEDEISPAENSITSIQDSKENAPSNQFSSPASSSSSKNIHECSPAKSFTLPERCKEFVLQGEIIEPSTLVKVFPGSLDEFRSVAAGTDAKVEEFLISHSTEVSSPTKRPASSLSPSKRLSLLGRGKRNPFSEEETEWVIEGFKKFGRSWSRILSSYNFPAFRTSSDIKDKAKNLADKNLIQGFYSSSIKSQNSSQ